MPGSRPVGSSVTSKVYFVPALIEPVGTLLVWMLLPWTTFATRLNVEEPAGTAQPCTQT